MNVEHLHATARQLRPPSVAAAAEFAARHEWLAAELNRRMATRPDLDRLIGPENRAMMEDNSRNFCRFLSTLFHRYEPTVLAETALWVFRAYRAHGFNTTYWPANLSTFIEIARTHLSPGAFAEVYPHFHWLVVSVPVLAKLTDPPQGGSDPAVPAARLEGAASS